MWYYRRDLSACESYSMIGEFVDGPRTRVQRLIGGARVVHLPVPRFQHVPAWFTGAWRQHLLQNCAPLFSDA